MRVRMRVQVQAVGRCFVHIKYSMFGKGMNECMSDRSLVPAYKTCEHLNAVFFFFLPSLPLSCLFVAFSNKLPLARKVNECLWFLLWLALSQMHSRREAGSPRHMHVNVLGDVRYCVWLSAEEINK